MEKEIKKLQEARKSMNGVALGGKPTGTFDTELYGANKLSGYSREVVDEVADDENGSSAGLHPATKRARQAGPEAIDGPAGEDFNPFDEHRKLSGRTTIAERESEYQAQRRDRQLSPERTDAFEDKTPARSYKDIMLSQNLDREKDEVLKKIATEDDVKENKKRRRWDDAGAQAAPAPSRFDAPPPQAVPGKFDSTPGRFDATPGRFDTTPGRFEATPGRFDATPGRFQATPGRFDATPGRFDATPGRFDATPGRFQATPGRFDSTPAASGRFDTTPGRFQATPGRFDATPGRFDVTPGRFDATPGRFDSTPGRFQATPGRFDATPGRFDATPGRFDATPGRFDATPGRFDATPGRFDATPGRFEATPGRFDATPSRFGSTPARDGAAKVSKWEATPGREAAASAGGRWDETPLAPVAIKAEDGTKQTSKRSRWDETPVAERGLLDTTSAAQYGPGDATPAGLVGAATPTPTSFTAASASFAAAGPVTPEMAQRLRWEREMHERNRYLSDEELDVLFPPTGYKILEPPAGYAPIHTPSRKLQATPTPLGGDPAGGFSIAATPVGTAPEGGLTAAAGSSDPNELPTIKPEDFQYFSKLMEDVDEDNLSADEAKELKIMRLLLKIKNGTPPQRAMAVP